MALKPTYEELEERVQELERGGGLGHKEGEALKLCRENYGVLCENILEALFVVQENRTRFVNSRAEDITGYSKEELLPKSLHDLIHPEDRHLFQQTQERTSAGDQGLEAVPFRLINKNGTELWIQVNTVPISWEEGPATLYLVRDITQQRELEARLRQAQRLEAIGRLAGGIAHDFNNILMPLMLNAEMALEDLEQDDDLRFNLTEVLKAGHRAKDLVRQILTFSRVSEDKKHPLKITPIVKEVIKFLRSSLPSNIEIEQEIAVPQDLDTVQANPAQIHQVIMNLCTNAYHAMRDMGGVLEVRLDSVEIASAKESPAPEVTPGKYLRLTVIDTGHGMPEDTLERIYDPHFSTKKNGAGTGLGLPAVKETVQDLHGCITIRSEPGKGTVVEVLFPYLEKEAPRETKDTGPIPGGEESLLFVEDEEAVAEALKRVLESFGYRVEAWTDGLGALEAFRHDPERFDLIITDQSMPEITGEDLAKEVRNIRPDIPVILCTGVSEEIDEDRAKEMGISAYVLKPVVMRQLAGIIREVLDKESS